MDHHCPFLSTCIGRRNYVYFFFFLVVLILDCAYVIAITAVDLARRFQVETDVLKRVPLSIPLLLLSTVALVMLLILMRYHLTLKARNLNTAEDQKQSFKGYFMHPYYQAGIIKNFLAGIFIPKPEISVFRAAKDLKSY